MELEIKKWCTQNSKMNHGILSFGNCYVLFSYTPKKVTFFQTTINLHLLKSENTQNSLHWVTIHPQDCNEWHQKHIRLLRKNNYCKWWDDETSYTVHTSREAGPAMAAQRRSSTRRRGAAQEWAQRHQHEVKDIGIWNNHNTYLAFSSHSAGF